MDDFAESIFDLINFIGAFFAFVDLDEFESFVVGSIALSVVVVSGGDSIFFDDSLSFLGFSFETAIADFAESIFDLIIFIGPFFNFIDLAESESFFADSIALPVDAVTSGDSISLDGLLSFSGFSLEAAIDDFAEPIFDLIIFIGPFFDFTDLTESESCFVDSIALPVDALSGDDSLSLDGWLSFLDFFFDAIRTGFFWVFFNSVLLS